MGYSPAVQMLVDEHDVILGVLEALEEVARESESQPVSAEFYEQALDFLSTFADKCHHAKEEDHLFPALQSRGIPVQGGPIACMLHDHDRGRAHAVAMREALSDAATGNDLATELLRRDALAYVELLRHHIYKENDILFIIGDQVLTDADKSDLLKKFNCAAHASLPAGTHEAYLALAKRLRGMAGLPATYTPDPTRPPLQSCGHHPCA